MGYFDIQRKTLGLSVGKYRGNLEACVVKFEICFRVSRSCAYLYSGPKQSSRSKLGKVKDKNYTCTRISL